ncbi:MAG: leucine-rich repeat protein [Paludibacteraceae bacterium]|nr:leucine-rich repeat protein [Paludibacteraceae bacterium]
MTNIVIPNGVTRIGDNAFCCSPMRKLVIRNLVTKKEPTTVENGSSLTSVTLPESLSELGKDVFLGCEKLETIYVPTKKANFYREHLPETLHDKIVEFELEQK